MKKFLSICLIGLLGISLMGCSDNSKEPKNKKTEDIKTESPSNEKFGMVDYSAVSEKDFYEETVSMLSDIYFLEEYSKEEGVKSLQFFHSIEGEMGTYASSVITSKTKYAANLEEWDKYISEEIINFNEYKEITINDKKAYVFTDSEDSEKSVLMYNKPHAYHYSTFNTEVSMEEFISKIEKSSREIDLNMRLTTINLTDVKLPSRLPSGYEFLTMHMDKYYSKIMYKERDGFKETLTFIYLNKENDININVQISNEPYIDIYGEDFFVENKMLEEVEVSYFEGISYSTKMKYLTFIKDDIHYYIETSVVDDYGVKPEEGKDQLPTEYLMEIAESIIKEFFIYSRILSFRKERRFISETFIYIN